uniref:Major sperm protein n=1 Tax=Caenorhabditis tropicalis TaxID=1561998 RepID=A0A1I7U776_9PELO
MILNLFAISALLGLAACSDYNSNGNNYGAANTGNYFLPPRHHIRRNHWRRSSSSSESDEKWECARLGVIRPPRNSNANLFSAPKIAYYTHQGKEKAIVVCENPQIQILVGKSENANPLQQNVTDYPIVSLSSKSGITLNCNKRKDRYEAVNLVTFDTVPLSGITCITADADGQDAFVSDILDVLTAAQSLF